MFSFPLAHWERGLGVRDDYRTRYAPVVIKSVSGLLAVA